MALVENNDMIEQIVPDRAHESFCDAILPWAFECRTFCFDSKLLQGMDNQRREDCIIVEEKVFNGMCFREGFFQLSLYP